MRIGAIRMGAIMITAAHVSACRSTKTAGASGQTTPAIVGNVTTSNTTTRTENRDVSTLVACSSAQPSPASRPLPSSALVLSLQLIPSTKTTDEASVRIESETSRTTVKINVAEPARFELSPGLYDVRVTLSGRVPVTARIKLIDGCVSQVTTVMRGRS